MFEKKINMNIIVSIDITIDLKQKLDILSGL